MYLNPPNYKIERDNPPSPWLLKHVCLIESNRLLRVNFTQIVNHLRSKHHPDKYVRLCINCLLCTVIQIEWKQLTLFVQNGVSDNNQSNHFVKQRPRFLLKL